MRKALWLAAASVVVLSACSQAKAPDDAATTEVAEAPAEVSADLVQPATPTISLPAPIAQIAYAFQYRMSVPRERGAELMSRHELTCAAAGAGFCQVVSAQADWTAREPGGRLELRGQPDWINRFRSGLALDAQNAGGRLDAAITEGENVTRDIDRAQTGAQTTASLAERIRDLQRQRGGTLAQRLEIERQLAELQRQFDEQQVALRDLNDRVQSASLMLTYAEGGVMAADNPTRPVAAALRDAFGLSMFMLAVLITIGSAALPVVAIGGAVWWAVLRRRRRAAAA